MRLVMYMAAPAGRGLEINVGRWALAYQVPTKVGLHGLVLVASGRWPVDGTTTHTWLGLGPTFAIRPKAAPEPR